MGKIKKEEKKTYKPLGLDRVYFDVKGAISSREVLKETKIGTVVCWDEDSEMPFPLKQEDYQKETGGFWGTEKEAAVNAVERMRKYVIDISEEIDIFNEIINKE